jgi:hypothetical protein
MKNKVLKYGLLLLLLCINSVAVAKICSKEQLKIKLDNKKDVCFKNSVKIEDSKFYKKFEKDFIDEVEKKSNKFVMSTIYYYPNKNEILVVAHRNRY